MIKIKSIIPNFNLAFIIIYKSRVNYNKFKNINFLFKNTSFNKPNNLKHF